MNNSNGGIVYQVIGNYEVVDTGKNEYLEASKGDIIIDCEKVDDNWFRGKNTRSGLCGLIPKANVISLQQHEYSELEPELLEKLSEEGVDVTCNSKENSDKTETDEKRRNLGESSYVDMSSEEALDCLGEKDAPQNSDEKSLLPKKSSMPKPPRHPSVSDSSKATNDEGYNSASHYSGENTDSNQPLLNEAKPEVQEDEAGYEVPSIGVKWREDEEDKGTKQRQKKKKKSLMMLWKGKGSDASSHVLHEKTPADEARENYYDPPADIRDNYFLPYTSKPTFRVVLSFIAALGISLTLFLVLLLLTNFHAVLSVSISVVVFVVLFVVPVTLYHRGILCVMLLLFPSLFGKRTKIAVVILLMMFAIIGPLFGTADKIRLASSCALHGAGLFEKNDTQTQVNAVSAIQRDCQSNFKILADYCSTSIYPRFVQTCKHDRFKKTVGDEMLCQKPKSYFCMNQTSLADHCSTLLPTNKSSYTLPNGSVGKLKVTKTFKDVLFYLLPLLTLLLLSEAYSYNKVYLTTKNTDNIYITQRLRELDTERRNRGLTDLILPLTRIELYTYLVRGNWNITKAERSRIVKWTGIMLVCVFVVISLILIEDSVNSVLQDIQTEQCLLYYKDQSGVRFRNVIYSLLGGFLFIIIMQNHCLRLRSVVCDYTYPEMVETRSKHLYYKILHDRHAFARHVRRNVQLLSEEKRLRLRISFFSKIYAVLPSRLQWVCNVFIVRTCMICNSLSYRKTVECTEPTCRAHYCFECHVDAGQNCLTCKTAAPRNNLPSAPRSSFCV